MTDLFNEDDNSRVEWKLNEQYAQKYEERKRKEELSRAADMGIDLDSDSESEEEDEGTDVDPALDAQIFDVIQRIRNKDPSVYDPKASFFNETQKENTSSTSSQNKNKEKKMTVGDYFHSKAYLGERISKLVDDDNLEAEEDDDSELEEGKDSFMTPIEEQEKLKHDFIRAAAGGGKKVNDVESAEDDDFLVPKVKNEEEKAQEEKSYREFLKSEEARLLKKRKLRYTTEELFKQPLSEEDKMLFGYTLDRKWIHAKGKGITQKNGDNQYFGKTEGGSDGNATGNGLNLEGTEDAFLEDDEKDLERQEEFEEKYNFRFEEPGGTEIVSFPRGAVEGSLRRMESKRKKARERKHEREEEMRKRHEEEVKRLKAMRREETNRKLSEIAELAGIEKDKVLDGKELRDLVEGDEEFDEEKFDKLMEEMFNDDYYEEDDDGKGIENWDEDILGEGDSENQEDDEESDDSTSKTKSKLSEEESKHKQKKSDSKSKSDHPFSLEQEELEKAKITGLKRFEEMLSKVKATEGADNKAKEEKLQATKKELKAFLKENSGELDYEDIIADGLKTRFKYRRVHPHNYNLTVQQVLESDDDWLNRHVPLKYITAPYRETDEPPKREWVRKWKGNKRSFKGEGRKGTQDVRPTHKADVHDAKHFEKSLPKKMKNKRHSSNNNTNS
ncbi:putative krr family protein [Monocercomonoides exilis]|uniref:putative krr family protein n=1 Tax=Monocercomonoides exilis TaxID=2049356 RepID=UPI003559810C|nr:putative krr family protein [Monocercomonoides exilis]|eukprot:MONOS_5703.1-p1 / transcript=MONOS_5703.1 / gene=MONOS_5703 / organism=Monocercomonoides_exilis_PA203 / gene_product=kri1 / transcript_product=kri1 / location=Mono_scaffold00169:82852-84935(+) / protein_length=671 / sequence_SO=supercontig / SO=protein_coding / is_pseudo=false